MTRSPRLMYLSTSSGVGGAERQVHDLAVRMRAAGWDVTVVSMLPLDSTFADLPDLGVATASLGMSQGRPDPRALIRLGSLLREARPDVLHAHMVHANLLARLSRLFRPRTPVVVSTMHNQYQGARWRMLAYRMTDRLGDVTTAVSDVARHDAVRQGAVAAERIATVYNGVDLSRYAEVPGARERLRQELGLGSVFAWLAVGRLTAAKDYPNLINACKRLADRRSQVLIAGTGPDEATIRQLVEGCGLAATVRLLGARSDVPELMQAADGFVMSSAWEGLPMVLLEAGASSLPIVATDVGGNREAVADGVTGCIVRAGDAVALADGMRRLMDLDPGGRRAMGAAGRRLTEERFDLDAIARQWDGIYRVRLAQRVVSR